MWLLLTRNHGEDHQRQIEEGMSRQPRTVWICHSTVAERAGGALLINICSHPRRMKRGVIAASLDGGMTWSKTWLDDALPDPGCQGSLLPAPSFTASPSARL